MVWTVFWMIIILKKYPNPFFKSAFRIIFQWICDIKKYIQTITMHHQLFWDFINVAPSSMHNKKMKTGKPLWLYFLSFIILTYCEINIHCAIVIQKYFSISQYTSEIVVSYSIFMYCTKFIYFSGAKSNKCINNYFFYHINYFKKGYAKRFL